MNKENSSKRIIFLEYGLWIKFEYQRNPSAVVGKSWKNQKLRKKKTFPLIIIYEFPSPRWTRLSGRNTDYALLHPFLLLSGGNLRITLSIILLRYSEITHRKDPRLCGQLFPYSLHFYPKLSIFILNLCFMADVVWFPSNPFIYLSLNSH